MEWIWNVLQLIGGYTIGSLVVSFSTIQVIISLRCAFPMLRLLKPYSYCFNIASCRRVYRTTVILHTIITAAVAIITWMFAPEYLKIGIYAGIVLSVVFSFGSTGMTDKNIADMVGVIGSRVYPGKDDALFRAFTRVLEKRL